MPLAIDNDALATSAITHTDQGRRERRRALHTYQAGVAVLLIGMLAVYNTTEFVDRRVFDAMGWSERAEVVTLFPVGVIGYTAIITGGMLACCQRERFSDFRVV